MSEKQQKRAIQASRTREKHHERRDCKQALKVRPTIDISYDFEGFVPIHKRPMLYNA